MAWIFRKIGAATSFFFGLLEPFLFIVLSRLWSIGFRRGFRIVSLGRDGRGCILLRILGRRPCRPASFVVVLLFSGLNCARFLGAGITPPASALAGPWSTLARMNSAFLGARPGLPRSLVDAGRARASLSCLRASFAVVPPLQCRSFVSERSQYSRPRLGFKLD